MIDKNTLILFHTFASGRRLVVIVANCSSTLKFCHAYVMVLHNCLRSIEERTAFCDVKFCHFIQEYIVPCTEVYSALRLASLSTEYMDNVWMKSMKNKCTQLVWKYFCASNSSSINYLLSVLPSLHIQSIHLSFYISLCKQSMLVNVQIKHLYVIN